MKAAPEICSATPGTCESKVAWRRPYWKRASLTMVFDRVELTVGDEGRVAQGLDACAREVVLAQRLVLRLVLNARDVAGVVAEAQRQSGCLLLMRWSPRTEKKLVSSESGKTRDNWLSGAEADGVAVRVDGREAGQDAVVGGRRHGRPREQEARADESARRDGAERGAHAPDVRVGQRVRAVEARRAAARHEVGVGARQADGRGRARGQQAADEGRLLRRDVVEGCRYRVEEMPGPAMTGIVTELVRLPRTSEVKKPDSWRRRCSKAAKKKVRSRTMGPPRVAPYCARVKAASCRGRCR